MLAKPQSNNAQRQQRHRSRNRLRAGRNAALAAAVDRVLATPRGEPKPEEISAREAARRTSEALDKAQTELREKIHSTSPGLRNAISERKIQTLAGLRTQYLTGPDELRVASAREAAARQAHNEARGLAVAAATEAAAQRSAEAKELWEQTERDAVLPALQTLYDAASALEEPDQTDIIEAVRCVAGALDCPPPNRASGVPTEPDEARDVCITLGVLLRETERHAVQHCGGLRWHSNGRARWAAEELAFIGARLGDDFAAVPPSHRNWRTPGVR